MASGGGGGQLTFLMIKGWYLTEPQFCNQMESSFEVVDARDQLMVLTSMSVDLTTVFYVDKVYLIPKGGRLTGI